MLPKGEGFQADDISPRNFDLWLIVKYKFVALDGASKLPVVDVDSRVLPCSSGGLILSSLSQQILQSSRSEWLKKMAGDWEAVTAGFSADSIARWPLPLMSAMLAMQWSAPRNPITSVPPFFWSIRSNKINVVSGEWSFGRADSSFIVTQGMSNAAAVGQTGSPTSFKSLITWILPPIVIVPQAVATGRPLWFCVVAIVCAVKVGCKFLWWGRNA
jgi:hypothetical protein